MGQSCSQSCGQVPRAGLGERGGFGPGSCAGLAPKLAAAPLRPAGIRPRREEETPVAFHTGAFQVSSAAPGKEQAELAGRADAVGSGSQARTGWRSAYALGPLLGDGISAKVYEAEALSHSSDSPAAVFEAGILGSCSRSCGGVEVPQCLRERSRRVAIKRYHRASSRTYQKELAALRRVGIHPNILRLLESFEGFDGEDALVLEYCDGSTLYDLYAREHPNGGLPERLVARLIQQLLLALEHLASRGVEHQDVKPENMMLHDVSVQQQQGELKLGDFGWAACAPPPGSARVNKLPVTGAGSLWYAPPELNPPVKGIVQETDMPTDEKGNPTHGRSDMWSVGVVLYLLLVGHNPFNTALKQATPEAIDNEVLRLAALGQINRRTDKWLQLHADARDFIDILLRVKPSARLSASQALHHPFLTKRVAKNYDSSIFFHGQMPAWADRDLTWGSLDGFQRLAWLAIAHAVAEPELDKSVVAGALEGMAGEGAVSSAQPGKAPQPGKAAQLGRSVGQGGVEAAYLWQLARELATTPVFQWLRDRGAWADVIRLAFCYLDVDADGVLGAKDLFEHIAKPASGDAAGGSWALANRWVARWQDPDAGPSAKGLPITSFRDALLDSHRSDDAILGGFEQPLSGSRRDGGTYRHDPGQADFADAYARPGHDEEEINWTDMSPTTAGAR